MSAAAPPGPGPRRGLSSCRAAGTLRARAPCAPQPFQQRSGGPRGRWLAGRRLWGSRRRASSPVAAGRADPRVWRAGTPGSPGAERRWAPRLTRPASPSSQLPWPRAAQLPAGMDLQSREPTNRGGWGRPPGRGDGAMGETALAPQSRPPAFPQTSPLWRLRPDTPPPRECMGGREKSRSWTERRGPQNPPGWGRVDTLGVLWEIRDRGGGACGSDRWLRLGGGAPRGEGGPAKFPRNGGGESGTPQVPSARGKDHQA